MHFYRKRIFSKCIFLGFFKLDFLPKVKSAYILGQSDALQGCQAFLPLKVLSSPCPLNIPVPSCPATPTHTLILVRPMPVLAPTTLCWIFAFFALSGMLREWIFLDEYLERGESKAFTHFLSALGDFGYKLTYKLIVRSHSSKVFSLFELSMVAAL